MRKSNARSDWALIIEEIWIRERNKEISWYPEDSRLRVFGENKTAKHIF